MIKSLVINNIALITHVELNFERGITVLSGETGSGKSIIVDSLAFVLGDRADKSLIKYGEEEADVTAIFQVNETSVVLDKLEEYGYERDCEIMISRKMSVSGKNEIRIQGKVTTLAILKDVCTSLVDIFGQGEHLNLLKQDKQLGVLDAFCNFGNDVNELMQLNSQLRNVNKELKSFGGSDAERERLIDILKYQIDEISNADISQDEENELLVQHKRIVNVEKIATAVSRALECLDGDSGAESSLSLASSSLNSITNVDEQMGELCNRLQQARLDVEDVRSTLEDIMQSTDYSEKEVDRIETRLEQIKALKRKYGGTVEDVLKFLADAESKYNNLVNSAERIEQLNSEKNKIIKKMYSLAVEKSTTRHRVAVELSHKIMDELSQLGMKGTTFEVTFNEQPTFEEYFANPDCDGFDKVEFMMSANVGDPVKPLAKVISGGEMSRFMLAIKNITAQAERIPTMVFDEIDTGISGSMAQKVAEKLADVSNCNKDGYQCIVITHLPQIVAMADVNLVISKYVANDKTVTDVTVTDKQGKIAEIARLMGAVGASGVTTATELLDWCDNYKKSI